jgi:hypothetical protein
MQDYEYDLPELVDQPEQQMPDSSSNQEIILPQSPAKRLKQISALEKLLWQAWRLLLLLYVF